MVRSHLQPRTTRIYSNNSVYAPDGLLLFRCSDKKVAWYLRRCLAERIPTRLYDAAHDPHASAIRLLFTPRGRGRNREGDAWYLETQSDCCVVCGRPGNLTSSSVTPDGLDGPSASIDSGAVDNRNHELQRDADEINGDHHEDRRRKSEEMITNDDDEEDGMTGSGLTLHHVVPYQYRKYMPLSFKSHASHDVLPLCLAHHEAYEVDANRVKADLVTRFDAPLEGRGWLKSPEYVAVKSAAIALLRYREKIPSGRLQALRATVREFYALEDAATLEESLLLEAAELRVLAKGPDFQEHGAIVVAALMQGDGEEGLARFIRSWRRHFLETLRPRFLSREWRVEDPVNLVAGEYNPYRPEMDGA